MTPEPLPFHLEPRRAHLGSLRLRADLVRFVRHRMRGGEAEDVVQDTLVDALAAPRAPDDPVGLRRWVVGIARKKVADRMSQRRLLPHREEEGAQAPRGEVDALDLVRWARNEVAHDPEDVRTLGWMVREGVLGESLANIAADEGLAPTRVGQRVSRLRRLLRDRWIAQAAVVAAAVVLLALAWATTLRKNPEPVRADGAVVVATPPSEAAQLREEAQAACQAKRWDACERALDRARELDPDGDTSPWVVQLRQLLDRMLRPSPAPVPTTSHDPKRGPQPSSTLTGSSLPRCRWRRIGFVAGGPEFRGLLLRTDTSKTAASSSRYFSGRRCSSQAGLPSPEAVREFGAADRHGISAPPILKAAAGSARRRPLHLHGTGPDVRVSARHGSVCGWAVAPQSAQACGAGRSERQTSSAARLTGSSAGASKRNEQRIVAPVPPGSSINRLPRGAAGPRTTSS